MRSSFPYSGNASSLLQSRTHSDMTDFLTAQNVAQKAQKLMTIVVLGATASGKKNFIQRVSYFQSMDDIEALILR